MAGLECRNRARARPCSARSVGEAWSLRPFAMPVRTRRCAPACHVRTARASPPASRTLRSCSARTLRSCSARGAPLRRASCGARVLSSGEPRARAPLLQRRERRRGMDAGIGALSTLVAVRQVRQCSSVSTPSTRATPRRSPPTRSPIPRASLPPPSGACPTPNPQRSPRTGYCLCGGARAGPDLVCGVKAQEEQVCG
jgi:hypothetical protein